MGWSQNGHSDEPVKTDPGLRLSELRAKVARLENEKSKHDERKTWLNVALVISSIGLFLTIWAALHKKVEDDTKPLIEKVKSVDGKLDKHIDSEEQHNKDQIKAIIEIYKVMPKRGRSSKMEKLDEEER